MTSKYRTHVPEVPVRLAASDLLTVIKDSPQPHCPAEFGLMNMNSDLLKRKIEMPEFVILIFEVFLSNNQLKQLLFSSHKLLRKVIIDVVPEYVYANKNTF